MPYGGRSADYAPSAILPEFVRPGPFVFLGKRRSVARIDYDEILADFDRLLPLYAYVKSGGREDAGRPAVRSGFTFQAGCTDRPRRH
jgi:hypothetical protein